MWAIIYYLVYLLHWAFTGLVVTLPGLVWSGWMRAREVRYFLGGFLILALGLNLLLRSCPLTLIQRRIERHWKPWKQEVRGFIAEHLARLHIHIPDRVVGVVSSLLMLLDLALLLLV